LFCQRPPLLSLAFFHIYLTALRNHSDRRLFHQFPVFIVIQICAVIQLSPVIPGGKPEIIFPFKRKHAKFLSDTLHLARSFIGSVCLTFKKHIAEKAAASALVSSH